MEIVITTLRGMPVTIEDILIFILVIFVPIIFVTLVVVGIKKIIHLAPERRKIVFKWIFIGVVLIIIGLISADLITYHINTTNAPGANKQTDQVLTSLKYHEINSISGEPSDKQLAGLTTCNKTASDESIDTIEDGCIKGYIVITTKRAVAITQVKSDLKNLGMTITNNETVTPEIYGYFPENKTIEEWEKQISKSKFVVGFKDITENYSTGKISFLRKISYSMIGVQLKSNSSDEDLKPFLDNLGLQGADLYVATGIDPAYVVSVPSGQELYWAKNIKQKINYITNSSIIFVKGEGQARIVPV